MSPQEKIEELQSRIEQLEKALALVNLQTVRRERTNEEARSLAKAFDEGRHFYLKVEAVPASKAASSAVVHRNALRLVIGDLPGALVKPNG